MGGVVVSSSITRHMPNIHQVKNARERFLRLISDDNFIQRMLCHMVNNKIQDFQDPLTSTLVLMATSPLQMVLCEAGLLPFKTTLLPVLPYSILTLGEIEQMRQILADTCDRQLHETVESSGQYTLSVAPVAQTSQQQHQQMAANKNNSSGSAAVTICRRSLLHAFVSVMMFTSSSSKQDENQLIVNRTLCNIVLQRFMASVSTPSEIVSSVMSTLDSYTQQHTLPPPDDDIKAAKKKQKKQTV